MNKLSYAFAKRKKIPYPTAREDYTSEVADVGEEIISTALEEIGIDTEYHDIHAHGADKVNNTLSFGGEVWDWSSPHCYADREESVVTNLEPYADRHLITSFISDSVSYRITAAYHDNPIEITAFGFQILPNDYKQWAINNKITYGVRFPNKRTIKIVKNRLLSNPKIRKAIAKKKLMIENSTKENKTSQSQPMKESNTTSCYVYTNTLTNPADNKTYSSNLTLDILDVLAGFFDGFKVKFKPKSVFSKIKSSAKARLSAFSYLKLSFTKHFTSEVLRDD